jgi:hypothetical protein
MDGICGEGRGGKGVTQRMAYCRSEPQRPECGERRETNKTNQTKTCVGIDIGFGEIGNVGGGRS